MQKIRKKIFLFVFLIIIIVSLFITIKGCKKSGTVKYTYGEVSVGEVEKTISVSGKLDLFDITYVNSIVTGTITKSLADLNEQVNINQLLAEIDSETADDNLESYKDTYKFAHIDVQNANEIYLAKKALFNEKLISQNELDNAKLNYDKVYSNYKNVKKEYERRLEAVKQKKVTAPIKGVIVFANATEGMLVSPGTQLFQITSTLEKLKLIINIDESDIGFTKIGQNVTFSVGAYPDKDFTGKIQQIGITPTIKDNIVTYESLVECKNEGSLLKPGMTATATVNIDKKENVLRVPNQSYLISPVDIEIKKGQKFVWRKKIVNIGKFPMEKVEIKTGIIGDTYTEVLSGNIKEGDEVLIGISKSTDK